MTRIEDSKSIKPIRSFLTAPSFPSSPSKPSLQSRDFLVDSTAFPPYYSIHDLMVVHKDFRMNTSHSPSLPPSSFSDRWTHTPLCPSSLKTLKERHEFGWFKVPCMTASGSMQWSLVFLDRGRFACDRDLPSIQFESGESWWYEPFERGQRLHRLTGPSIVIPGQPSRFFIHGQEYHDSALYLSHAQQGSC